MKLILEEERAPISHCMHWEELHPLPLPVGLHTATRVLLGSPLILCLVLWGKLERLLLSGFQQLHWQVGLKGEIFDYVF